MVDDLGQVLNPMIVNGQQHGGVAQGIGQALYELPSMPPRRSLKWYAVTDAPLRQRLQAPVTLVMYTAGLFSWLKMV